MTPKEKFLRAYLRWTATQDMIRHIEDPEELNIKIMRERNEAWNDYVAAREYLEKMSLH